MHAHIGSVIVIGTLLFQCIGYLYIGQKSYRYNFMCDAKGVLCDAKGVLCDAKGVLCDVTHAGERLVV